MAGDSREVLTRPAPPPDFTLTYGIHPDQVADVRLPRPRGQDPLPRTVHAADVQGGDPTLVIFLHGGFWRSEYDRAHTGPLACALAEAGYLVVTPEYRRTGQAGGGWPGTFDDVRAALAVVPALVAAQVGVDRPRIVLAGHSAGGQLALWAAAMARVSGDPAGLCGVVALAPVADLGLAYKLDLDGGAVSALLGGGPEEFPDRYTATDPMSLLPVGVRIVAVHGARDHQVPVEFSRQLVAEAVKRGDDARLTELPMADHFAVIDPTAPAWAAVLAAMAVVSGPSAGVDSRTV